MLFQDLHTELVVSVNILDDALRNIGRGNTDRLMTVLSDIKTKNQHLLNLMDRLSNLPDADARPLFGQTNLLDTLLPYVEENIDNAMLKVSDLAAVVHMSERSLNRRLKALTGDSPSQWLIKTRLKYAKRLLDNSEFELIGTIGYRAGFVDASHFTRSFKAYYSLTPSEYRKMQWHYQ